jgi:hypothetical protein
MIIWKGVLISGSSTCSEAYVAVRFMADWI